MNSYFKSTKTTVEKNISLKTIKLLNYLKEILLLMLINSLKTVLEVYLPD